MMNTKTYKKQILKTQYEIQILRKIKKKKKRISPTQKIITAYKFWKNTRH